MARYAKRKLAIRSSGLGPPRLASPPGGARRLRRSCHPVVDSRRQSQGGRGGPASRLPSRAVRVVDLDRDMSDVIPTGTTRDSTFLFERMTRATLGAAAPAPGRRILDVASGFGQDAFALRRARRRRWWAPSPRCA